MNLGFYYSPSLCWYDLNVNAKLFKKLFILHLQQQNYPKKHLVILLFLHCLGSSPWFISSSTLTLNPFQYLVNLKQIIFHNPDNKNDNIMGKVIVLWIAHLLQEPFCKARDTLSNFMCWSQWSVKFTMYAQFCSHFHWSLQSGYKFADICKVRYQWFFYSNQICWD